MKRGFLRRATLGLFIAAFAVSPLGAWAADSAANPSQPLAISLVPKAVQEKKAKRLADLPESTRLQFAIVLPGRNQKQLDKWLKYLHDPKNPQFGRFLKPAEFTERFGPTQADYNKVVAWAKENGFDIRRTTPSRRVLSLTGTVKTINRALQVKMGRYQHSTGERSFFAADRDPTLDIGVPVYSISGLSDYSLPNGSLKKEVIKAKGVNASGPDGAFTPGDIRKAYVGDSPLTGRGQKVGIFSFKPYFPPDLQIYVEEAGITLPPHRVIAIDSPSACTNLCADGKQIADIGNVAGVAPGLEELILYVGPVAVEVLDRMLADNTASVILNTWSGGTFEDVPPDLYNQFTAQNQFFVQMSGDDGAYPSTEAAPVLNPWTTNIGGTILTTDSEGAWAAEVAWPSSGGGYDVPPNPNSYPLPRDYQYGPARNPGNGASIDYRNGPDLAAEASNNFTVENMQVQPASSTGFAAARWAAFIALINEGRGGLQGWRYSYLNNQFYLPFTVFNVPSTPLAYHDITQGNNGHGNNPGFNAVPGYDLVTGLGSPKTGLFALAPAPVINQPQDGQIYKPALANATISGTGQPGWVVGVSVDSSFVPLCGAPVGPDGNWSCSGSPGYQLVALTGTYDPTGNHTFVVNQRYPGGFIDSPTATVNFSIEWGD